MATNSVNVRAHAQNILEGRARRRFESQYEEAQREYERALEAQTAAQTAALASAQQEQNQGGLLGGIGYSLEKIGLGFLSGIEGIWDYTAGGLAKLFGADDWAEQQIANDWVNYNHADEWFNPSEGWQFVGDVAGGIGTSLPSMAGVAAAGAITVASGGTLSPVAATLIAGSIAGLGAAGRATKEAYDQTGELGGKEFGYGALSGITEGAIEGVSSALGAGTGAVIKSISKSFGKEVAKSATRNTLLKGVVKGFAGEAFEEGVQAILEPVYKRMTYDPNAKNATFQEVAYAALVGGLSGAIMGGGDVAVRNIRGTTRGNTLVNEGRAGDVITTAEQLSSYQTANQTDYETFQVVQNTLGELKTSLQKTGGEVRTVRQKMLLGVLEQANTSAAFEPIVTASAENIYNNAETVAARLNELGYQDQNGKPIQVTAEQIREGIDTTDAKKFRQTMSKALKTNSVLRTLAVADTVGQISIDTARFRDAALSEQSSKLITSADLNRFAEQATDTERQAVADRLGIENWETLTNEQFHDKITEFVANGGVQEYQQERVYVKEAQAVAPEAAKKHLPRMVNLRNDGTYRYTQGSTDIAITKRGDSYYVYDYESGLMSKALSRTETNRVLREIYTNEENYQNGVRQHTEAQNRLREQAAEIDTYARENISEYKNLSAAGQAAIRATIRQGRAAGVQEDFVLSCARVSARSGLRVVFSKEASFVAANGSYADGAIDLKNNRIIINPEAKSRSGESILIHELTHAIYNDTNGSLTVAEGLETMTDAEKEKIRKRYAAVGQGRAAQVSDEINAHFAEQTLSNKNILERLVQKKQTLKEKILGFFKKARTDYQSDEKLTGAAARLYRQYKKLFDDFSTRNQRYLGTENASAEAQEQAAKRGRTETIRFSLMNNRSFEDNVQDILTMSDSEARVNVSEGNFVSVMKHTPDVILNNVEGAQDLEVIIRFDALYLASRADGIVQGHYHDLGVEITKRLPQLISDPDAIVRMDNGRLNIFAEMTTDKGNNGIIAIELNTVKDINSKNTKYNLVVSAFSAKDNYVRNTLQKRAERVEYTKKDLSQVNHQLYEWLATINERSNLKQSTSPTPDVQAPSLTSETGRRIKTTSTSSISQNAENVNPSERKGKKYALPNADSDGNALSDEQRAYFSMSKITDAEGRLLSLYHGSNAYDEIHVFRRGKNGYLGGGIYLTDSESYARKYADKNGYKGRIYNVYADAKNPLEVSTNTPAKEILRAIYGSDRVYDRRSAAQSYETQLITSADIRKLRDKGFDAIVWRFGGSTEVSVFEANQIKLTSNKAPTAGSDVRYALSIDGETVSGAVEETRNLVALHNLSEDNLLRVIDLGGFPMPSIAVTTTELPHENYGNITVVFGRETIDPESDSRNVVYDRDAWTPTTPIVDVKLNNQRVDDLITDLQKETEGQPAFKSSIENFFDGKYRDNNGDYIVRDYDYTREAFGERGLQNSGIMAAYLGEKGISVEPVYAEKGFLLGWESYTRGEAASLLDYVGITKDITRDTATEAQRQSILEKFIDYKARKNLHLLRRFSKNKNLTLEEVKENLRSEYDDGNVSQLFFMAEDFFNERRPKDIYDENATVDKMREKISDKQDFYDWLWAKIESVYEKRGIDNDSEIFDSRGNRRSFEQRHFSYTAANIVKAMSKGAQEGKANLGMTAGALAARLSTRFESIDDIRDAKEYLALVSEEDLKAFNDRTYELYDELVTAIAGKSSDFMSDSTRRDDVGQILAECAAAKPLNIENIKRIFARETRGYKLGYKFDDSIAEQAMLLFESLKHVPTTYFEAKPRRVVKLSEIKYVLVPENASAKLIEVLKKNKISYRQYGAGSNARAKVLTQLDGVRFALPETDSAGESLSAEQREYFKGSKVVDNKGRLLTTYHGSPNRFFTFDRGRIGKGNDQFGAGFYFATSEEASRSYGDNVHKTYLNITKPIVINRTADGGDLFDVKITQKQAYEILKRHPLIYDPESSPLGDMFEEYWEVGAKDYMIREAAKNFNSIGLLDSDYLTYRDYPNELHEAIRDVLGYDGVEVRFDNTGDRFYVAWFENQIKLTTNKQPTGDADIRFALSDSVVNVDSANETAAWTSDRVTDLIDRYGARNPRYTQAYATWINPADFVKATTVSQTRRNQIYNEAGNLDIDALSRETQTPYLTVDYETMRIVGHEGRHRMAALAKAGVKRVAVAIRFTENSLSRYDARIMDGEHKLKGQSFSSWDADAQRVRTRTSHNSAAVGTLVPINAAYSAQLSEFTSERGVRFALDSSEDGNAQTRGNYSVGQRARFAANNTGMRVYTKAEAAEVINSIIEERLVFEEIGMQGELRGKDRQAVIDYLFQKLNTVKEGYRSGVALRIADYMIEHTVLTDMYADSNGEVSEAMHKLSVLRRYMHRIDLRHIQDEVQYRFDRKNSINLVWGAKEGGIAPDTLPQLLAEEGIFLDAINEADCFLQMVDMYEDARAAVNNATEQVMLSTYGDARTIKNLRQQIARDVLNAYEQKGRKSKYAKLVEKYTKQIAELKQRLREANANNRLINSIVDQAQKMRDLKLGTFQNATQYDTEIFRSSIEKLGKIKFRGNFNIAGTRKIMADLRTWYTKENPLLSDTYEQGIADMLDEVANGKTNNYTKSELQSIRNIMAYFTNYVEHFNKVYRQGRWVDAVPEATRYIDILHRNEELKSSWFMRKVGTSYLQTFGDPMSVMRRMDRYESGFYTEIFTELRDSKIDAEIAKMQLMEEYEAFLKKNKKYLAQATKETVQYRGVEIPRMQLISLYMTLKRQHAQAGLAENGFGFWNAQDQRVRVDGFAKGITEESELRAAAVDEQARIAELLTETDKEYIAILEKGYQEAGRLKAERDIQRLGFTNATEDYYYPIRRGNIAKNVDSAEIQAELDRISNASFNKDTVRGAKQELYIESADVVFNRHVRGVVQYAYISPAIETYNKLYNLDIAGTPNKPVSVSTESANVWKQGNDYFKKLITDIQGISPVSSEGRAVLSFIRGSYAKFQLGANPKVWATQLSSLFAASSILDASSIANGMFISSKDVDVYCPLAKLRAQDNTVAMAQGVLDKVGRVSNALMAPIGKMDRFVVCRLFGACQLQVQKNGGAKVGTEANKIEAGKLLKRVILETQQNSLATERSAAMRSGNEIMRTVTMFSADSMKVIGRVIDSVGELSTLNAKLRMATDTELAAELRTQINAAQKKVFKSVTALTTSALFMAAITQLFNWLYNKDRDDDETASQQVLVDFAGNLLGGLPLVRDIYSRIMEGYSVDNYAYSALNDLLDSAVNLFDTASSLISGNESKSKLTARTKNLLYALGQLTGIPTRNIYNVFYGLIKRFIPTAAYQIDEWFYAKNYVTDLNKAIENDDTDMISMLTSMIFGERMGNTTMSDAVRDKFVDLYSKGYSVLPRSIGDTISYGGIEIPLTDDEYARFRAIYAQSMKDIEKMMNNGAFKVLSEEMQAKAIKQVYDAYYYDALSDLVGVDERTTIGELSKWIDLSKLSVVFVGLSDVESEKNSKGETIAGSKKKNTVKYLLKQNLSDGERLLILCFRGYSIQDGDYKGYTAKRAKRILLQYILKLKCTQAEKAALAEKCGFTVRNGRIIKDF